jgi:hypothetical protein
MHFQSLIIALLLFSALAMAAPSRGPAVEDFVGIEVEEARTKSHNDEVLFNLERDVDRIETARKGSPVDVATQASSKSLESPFSIMTLAGLIVMLSLPFISWILVMNHLRQKASAESASNIEVLQKYRKDREQLRSQSKGKEDRKVS